MIYFYGVFLGGFLFDPMINLLAKASAKSSVKKKSLCFEQVNKTKYIYSPQYFISVEWFLCRMYCVLDNRFVIYCTDTIREYFQ